MKYPSVTLSIRARSIILAIILVFNLAYTVTQSPPALAVTPSPTPATGDGTLPSCTPSVTIQTQNNASSCWDDSFAASNGIDYYKPGCTSTGANAQNVSSVTAGTNTNDKNCGETGYSSGKRDSQANKQQIWNFLKGKGLSDNAAAGIMGNMESESAFMPDAVNSLGCSGIVQWCFGRNSNLRSSYSKWDCLSNQLDFMWNEVTKTGEAAVMKDLNAAATPHDAGNVWANEYERMKPSELAGRADNAEKIYEEFTGKTGSSPSTASGGSSDTTACPDAKNASMASPSQLSADCASNVAKLNQLVTDKKVVITHGAAQQDIANCGKIASCSGGNGGGGIDANTARAIVAVAEQSGVKQVTIMALNSDHECDGGEHPKGLGIDIAYNEGDPEGEKAYKYLYDHASELGVNKLIWGTVDTPGWTPMAGYQCMYNGQPIDCYTTYSDAHNGGGNHIDHIHVSMSPSNTINS